jgi:hypothetical protein
MLVCHHNPCAVTNNNAGIRKVLRGDRLSDSRPARCVPSSSKAPRLGGLYEALRKEVAREGKRPVRRPLVERQEGHQERHRQAMFLCGPGASSR